MSKQEAFYKEWRIFMKRHQWRKNDGRGACDEQSEQEEASIKWLLKSPGLRIVDVA